MEAHPSVQHVKVYDRKGLFSENDVVELDRLKLLPIQPVGCERTNKKNVVHDRADSRYEFCRRCAGKCVSVNFDNSRERERNVEDRDPRVGFVFHMARDRPFVRVDAHEQLASLREQLDELPVMGKELLDGLVVTEVPEVGEYGHESFRFEWERVHINLCRRVSGVDDSLALDLVGEKGGDDGEETIDDIVLADNVECDRWYREELEGEVFDRGLGLAVHEEIGVNNPMINVGKV